MPTGPPRSQYASIGDMAPEHYVHENLRPEGIKDNRNLKSIHSSPLRESLGNPYYICEVPRDFCDFRSAEIEARQKLSLHYQNGRYQQNSNNWANYMHDSCTRLLFPLKATPRPKGSLVSYAHERGRTPQKN